MEERRRSLLLVLALAALTVAAYAPGFGNRFVNYDDDLYITDRPEVRAGVSADGVAWAFTSTQGANWFPLTRLSWMVDAEIFGMNPAGFHGVNLALHVLNTLLLFAALRRLSGAAGPAAFAAGVFALHPLHVESVAWAAARKDLLAGLFFALALLAHERCARGGRPLLWRTALAVLLALGLMAKPMLVTLPFVLLLLDEWPLGRLRDRAGGALVPARVGRALLEKLPLLIMVAAACVVTVWAQSEGGALRDTARYPFWLRVGNALESLVAYLSKAFWPGDLSVFYPYPHAGVSLERAGLGAALLVGVSAVALRELRRRPYLAVGWFWFLGMLVPVSGLVQVGQAAMADRYTYLPLTGLAVVLAWGSAELAGRWPALAPLLRRIGIALLLVLAWITSLQIGVWRNSRTLFEHALTVHERNHVAHINLGLALAGAGKLPDAERHLTTAVAIAPRSPHAHGIRGEVRLADGRGGAALLDFRSALRLDPESVRWETGLARALAEQGEYLRAEAALRQALKRDPGWGQARAVLAAVLLHQGRVDEALESYRRALENPAGLRRSMGQNGVAAIHAQLASLYESRGQLREALAELERALRLDPRRADLHDRHAALLGPLGDESGAIDAYRKSLRLGERTPRALNNLAWILATAEDTSLRNPAEAARLAEEAVELTGGRDASVLDTLAAALEAGGRQQLALSAARRALVQARSQGDTALVRSIRARIARLEASDGEGTFIIRPPQEDEGS